MNFIYIYALISNTILKYMKKEINDPLLLALVNLLYLKKNRHNSRYFIGSIKMYAKMFDWVSQILG